MTKRPQTAATAPKTPPSHIVRVPQLTGAYEYVRAGKTVRYAIDAGACSVEADHLTQFLLTIEGSRLAAE